MSDIEENIRQVLDGQCLGDSDDLCDFTLSEQNEAVGKQKKIYHYYHELK